MEPTWTQDGSVSASSSNADAGPSSSRSRPMTIKRRRLKASKPFVSADHRPAEGSHDGVFRVVVITSGSVASVKLPLIVGALCKNENIDIQVVATKASRHFYTQQQVDEEVARSSSSAGSDDDDEHDVSSDARGVRVWVDEDEWSDWRNLGDPILHIELRRWADLIVVAPCSADFLAKLAAGFSDNLPLSLLRALPQSTPVIICPAMNTHMYSNPFTREHLVKVETQLGYLISGPQGAGRLACGDEGPGKMTDWRDIVDMIETFATVFRRRHSSAEDDEDEPPIPAALNPPLTAAIPTTSADEQDGADDKCHGYTGDLGANIIRSHGGSGPSHSLAGNNTPRSWGQIWPVHPIPQ